VGMGRRWEREGDSGGGQEWRVTEQSSSMISVM
jgi:hypothetical protein